MEHFGLVSQSEITPHITLNLPWYPTACFRAVISCPELLIVVVIFWQKRHEILCSKECVGFHMLSPLCSQFAGNLKAAIEDTKAGSACYVKSFYKKTLGKIGFGYFIVLNIHNFNQLYFK